MARGELEREAERVVEQGRLRGQAEQARAERERRRDARIQPDAAHIVVGDDPWVYLINVSRRGLAFYSALAHPLGSVLPVSLESGVRAEAKVVECRPETDEPGALAGQFHVCCEFVDGREGLRFLLALDEWEAARLEADPR
jgi:hypothetical protein